MRFTAFGGAAEVGGTCLLLQIAGKNILLDAGIRVNRRGEASLPDLARLESLIGDRLDLVLVSHAHLDHTGALPLIHERYPQARIYATLPTYKIVAILLQDTVRIMEQEEEEATETPLYDRAMVERALWAMDARPFREWFEPLEGVRVSFHPAGHILGAACILIETAEGKVVYTGDVATASQRTVAGMEPIDFFQPDVVITEATYGDSNHAARKMEEQRLAHAVSEIIQQGGTVLIPSFALGRAQEIILILKFSIMSGLIPKFPLFVDGMVRAICDTYADLGTFLPGKLQNYLRNSQQPIFWSRPRRNIPEVTKLVPTERPLMLIGQPKCIISSSGMLSGGPSVFYAKGLAPDEKNAIFLTGYQDEESPGRRLQELQQGDTLVLNGQEVPVHCRVNRYNLSAHADQIQMCQQISYMDPKQVVLLHGEWHAIQALREKLVLRAIVHTPRNGETVDLSNPPEWLSDYRLQQIDAEHLTYQGQIGQAEDGSVIVRFDPELAQSPQWQQFFEEHTMVTAKFMGKWLHLKGASPPDAEEDEKQGWNQRSRKESVE